jgi:hypothetical protein
MSTRSNDIGNMAIIQLFHVGFSWKDGDGLAHNDGMRHVFHAHLQGVFKTAQQEDRRRMSSLKRRMSNWSTFFF